MKILIVDDEITSRLKAKQLVKSLGYETLVAENGRQALALWQTEKPRVVITDWMMPEMDGLQLCANIRRTEGQQYTYIIMVTFKDTAEDLTLAMERGVDDFIRKPFRKQELAARLKPAVRTINLQTRDLVIFSLAKLTESRDTETGNHLERIRHYSQTLTKHLAAGLSHPVELNEEFIENIFHTSPLHDIGKVGIPDYILLKPDRLDDEEFRIMKTHTVLGHETLIEAFNKYPSAEYLRMSAEIALSHHEKYNGGGYPHGLRGDAIPFAARIVALADVYDALVSKRAYKEAMPKDIARNIIFEEKGRHFDPVVVKAFAACEAEFVEINERFSA